jgi:hypothetical protein
MFLANLRQLFTSPIREKIQTSKATTKYQTWIYPLKIIPTFTIPRKGIYIHLINLLLFIYECDDVI